MLNAIKNGMLKKLSKRYKNNLKYQMIITWSDEDSCYLVSLPDLTSQKYVTHGNTYEHAAKNGREVIELLIDMHEDRNQPLPVPNIIENT